MPELTYSAHAVLPDGATLLAVVETTRVRRWFRVFELCETRSYVLKGGFWWGRDGAVPHRDPKHLRLSEIAMMQVVRASVDAVVSG